MFVYRKKEILRSIKEFQKVNDFIARSTGGEDVVELLTQCQEEMIAIGTYIENNISSSELMISYIEQYCETLYQMSLTIHDIKQNKKYSKLVQKQLTQLYNIIRERIPNDKKHIVFLPYKVSMWDSMESIWKAACQDENCITYVVPIPYFERNSAGLFDKMHYEGDQYPDYIPVISWKEINIEKLRPDVIYVHNPYENCNFVTSIHPDYYASRLKRFTDSLVYVPYYFTAEDYPRTHLALPIYQFADLIVAQNETVKKMLENAGVTTKVAALGSPKIDRLLYAQQNMTAIPEELADVYGHKKLLLLNTSIDIVLKYKENYLKKISDVFRIFHNRADVALIWRPHPLLEATIKGLETELYPLYMRIKEMFFENKVGIYDSGMDLNWLVTNVDAYIGEQESSIVGLFAVLGKPIYIINPRNEEIFEYKNVAFFDYYIQDKKIYFADADCGRICIADKENCVVEEVIPIRDSSYVKRSYTEIVEHNEVLYFTPMMAKKILCFNKNTKEIQEIMIPNAKRVNFCRVLQYHEYLYYIPTEGNEILRLDCNTKEIKMYQEPVSRVRKNNKEKGFFSMFASQILDHSLFIASPISNYVIEFDVETEEIKEYLIDSENQGYWDMVYDGTDFWLNPYKGSSIIRWNKSKGVIKQYNVYPNDFIVPKDEIGCFIQIVDCEDSILAFPKYANMIIEINKESGDMSEVELSLPYEEGMRKDSKYTWDSNYYFAKKEGHKVMALSAYDHSLLEIDWKQHSCMQKQFIFSKEVRKQVYGMPGGLNNYLYKESDGLTLEDFVNGLCNGQINDDEKEKEFLCSRIENSNGTCGMKVHEYVMQEFCNE